MEAYERRAHVGHDGILRLELPISRAEVDLDVLVILNEIPSGPLPRDVYGACSDLGLHEPDDLPLQPVDCDP